MAAIRKKVDKLNQSREQGTLHHHQCIDELTSHLRSGTLEKNSKVEECKLVSPTRSETPTSFVTVIEVKDPSPVSSLTATSQAPTSIAIASDAPELLKRESTSSSPELQRHDSKHGSRSSIFEENNTPAPHPVEAKRKIPPRYHILTLTYADMNLKKEGFQPIDSFKSFQTTTKDCASRWTSGRITINN